jgi:integrase
MVVFAIIRTYSPKSVDFLWDNLWGWADTSSQRVRRTPCPFLSFEPTNAVCERASECGGHTEKGEALAQKIQRLTALKVARTNKPGLYADGAGLYLRVGRGGAKSWAFRFMLKGKPREMGFGSFTKVSLADARKKAGDARLLLSDGRDPLEARQEEQRQLTAAEKLATSRSMTFDQCADAYIGAHEASWKNDKHRQQWRNTLATYVSPVLGSVPVQDVTVELIMKVIEPLWKSKTETARRIRGRIEVILDWARVRGYRTGENPARWRGNIDHLLPARSKVRPVRHHAALPYTKIGGFMKDLRSVESTSAAALEFLILTAARTGEVIGTRWPEINLKDQIWTVPAERMKSRREHRVPLSSAVITILKRVACSEDGYVFSGRHPDTPLSNMALLMMLGRMNCGDITAHGFRSTFRDWAAECTNFPSEVVEMALAHVIEDKTEAAYRRGTLFEKRRLLMEAWASFCEAP